MAKAKTPEAAETITAVMLKQMGCKHKPPQTCEHVRTLNGIVNIVLTMMHGRIKELPRPLTMPKIDALFGFAEKQEPKAVPVKAKREGVREA